jgi:hypothetical protein
MELYSRVPVTVGAGSPDKLATAGVTLWATSTPQTGYKVSSDNTILSTSGNSSPVVVHGLTYLPGAVPNLRQPLNTGAGGASIFMGGIVAKGLILDVKGNQSPPVTATLAGASASEEVTTTTTSTADRNTLLCATAASTDGGASTVAEALVRPDSADGTNAIQSWRMVTSC